MDNLAEKIKTELIEVNYYNDIKYNIKSKSRWKFIGDFTETISYIFNGMTVILTFACGTFDNILLSFVAGVFGIIALVLLKFSSYAMKESKERAEQVNILLKKLKIEEIESIV